MRGRILTWAGVALSVGLIIYIAEEFDLKGAIHAIGLANPAWFALAAMTYMIQFPLRGLRWSILMRAIKPVSFATATEVFTIGFMANNVLPLRLGDVARAFILAKREGVTASATFSNVMLERVFDGLTVVGFLSLALWIDPPATKDIRLAEATALLAACAFVGAVIVAMVVAYREQQVLRIARAVLKSAPPRLTELAVALVERLARGLHCLKRPRETLLVILLSVVIWSAEVVVYVLAQRSIGLSISPPGLALVMAILSLGLTVPSAPGFVGVYEGLIIASVGWYGVSGPLAPAFAIIMHLIHYVPGTLFGLIATWRNGLHLRELRSAAGNIGEGVVLNDAEGAKASAR
jgi:uncharacterized protein (TIRG00374 family)